MSYYRREIRFGFGDPLTPAVRNLMIANAIVFVIQVLSAYEGGGASRGYIARYLLLEPLEVLPWNFQIWRLFTYMFLHADFWHLFWNMFGLFIFGCSVEAKWGSRSFYRYYFLCGLGGALVALVPFDAFWAVPILGASGAVYGVMMAFAVMFPYRQILLMFVFPIQARYLVLLFGLISFVSAVSGAQGVAHTVHLGGLVTGFVLLRWVGIASVSRVPGASGFGGSVRESYRKWRMKRLRKKFESYYEKRSGGGGGGAVH